MPDHHLWPIRQMAAETAVDPPWDWLREAYFTLEQRLTDPAVEYPCHFGVQGQRQGRNWFSALDLRLGEAYGVPALARSLLAFRRQAWTGPKRQSLIVFVGPPEPEAGLEGHHAQFWDLLAGLSAVDPEPWLESMPRSGRDQGWQWCFAGEPWFVFACSPGYSARRSRNLGPCLTLVFQTRRVFEGLAGSTPSGRAAKREVRARLIRYDDVPPHPHLGDIEHSSVYKWRQYALPDDGRILPPEACSFGRNTSLSPAGRSPQAQEETGR